MGAHVVPSQRGVSCTHLPAGLAAVSWAAPLVTKQPAARARLPAMAMSVRERWSGMGRRGIALMLLLLAVPVAVAACATAIGWFRLAFELSALDRAMPIAFRVHMGAAGLALVLMPLAITLAGTRVHKLVGRSAAALGLLGGVTALAVASASAASLPARLGFLAQGIVWIVLLSMAELAIRKGDRHAHAHRMTMATAVASGAIWLRCAMWAAVAAGVPSSGFEAAYALAAWFAWLLPLGVTAWLGRTSARQAGSDRRRARPAGPGLSPAG